MKEQNEQMKAAIAEMRVQTHRTNEKVRGVAARAIAPVYRVPPPSVPPLPEGAVPAFVTANKQLQFGAITITPGGFLAADNIFRTRTTQSDINTAWNSIPTNNSGLAHTNEDKLSARATRFALLAKSQITATTLVAGYGEFDLQGAGTTSNNNQSFSYVPRVRNLYSTLDLNDYGLHVLAGQSWSLVTLNSKGITPRNEVTPPSIDAGYVPGFEYTRAPQIRITKDFNRKLWLAIEAEAPQPRASTVASAVMSSATTPRRQPQRPVSVPVPA